MGNGYRHPGVGLIRSGDRSYHQAYNSEDSPGERGVSPRTEIESDASTRGFAATIVCCISEDPSHHGSDTESNQCASRYVAVRPLRHLELDDIGCTDRSRRRLLGTPENEAVRRRHYYGARLPLVAEDGRENPDSRACRDRPIENLRRLSGRRDKRSGDSRSAQNQAQVAHCLPRVWM